MRRALLEADVNVGVVRSFIDTVTEQAIGEEILQGVNLGQQVVQTA